MDLQLLDKILPVLSVLIGAIVGFFGNYFVGKSLFKNEVNQKKEIHLRDLFNQYSTSVNASFHLINDLIVVLKNLHDLSLTKQRDQEFVSNVNNIFSNSISSLRLIDDINTKFDFTTALELNKILSEWYSIIYWFQEYISKIESSHIKKPIRDKEIRMITERQDTIDEIQKKFQEKMREYYSLKFLPHK